MKLLALALALTLVATLTACSAPPQPSYRSLIASPRGSTATPSRGTIAGDFAWAAQSTTASEAVERWQEFLGNHAPPDGDFEDGFHARHVGAARVELIRAHYLAGQVEEADELFRRLDFSPTSVLE